MKLARYWARVNQAVTVQGETVDVTARGWSDISVEGARECARNVARKVGERVITHPGEKNQYQYGDRPIPEAKIRELSASAVVTRNLYGSLVLNVDDLFFADVDRENAMDSIRQVVERHGLSGRVYRTAAGYRVMVPNAKFIAGSGEAEALLREFGSDPLYVHLCRTQNCFRARLSPKPWRCDFRKPPLEFPFETPDDVALFQQWEADYNRHASRYATCRYEATIGGVRILPEFEGIIEYHDQETKANTSLNLA